MVHIKSKKLKEEIDALVQVCNGDTCSICVKECLMLEEYMQSPKTFFEEFLVDQSINPVIPFSCTQCGYCEKVCPKGIKTYKCFEGLKKQLQEASNKKPVLNNHYSVYLHQKFSHSKIFKGYKKGAYKRAFMPGCSLSAYSPLLVEKTFEYLRSIDAQMGSIVNCCSKPMKDLGHDNAFEVKMNIFKNEVSKKGINEIIVGCQNCYNMIKQEYPDIRVKTIWHVFDEEGLPTVSSINWSRSDQYVIHDPCPVENTPEVKEIIRRILKSLGYKIYGSKPLAAKCCGLGAMAAVSNTQLAKKVTAKRIDDLAGNTIINYCAACTEAMGQGEKESVHLLELIFDSRIKGKNNTLKKWKNRLETKYRIT